MTSTSPRIKKPARTLLWVLLDVLLVNASLFLAQVVRYSSNISYSFFENSIRLAPAMTVIFLLVFCGFGMYRTMWQYASANDVLRIALATLVASLITYLFSLAANAFVRPQNLFRLHRMVYLLFWIISMAMVGASRLLYRIAVTRERFALLSTPRDDVRRVMVVGAGWAGASIVHEMQRGSYGNRAPVLVVDDDRIRTGSELSGVPVVRGSGNILKLASDYRVDEIIIAIATPKGDLKPLIEKCLATGCRVRRLAPLQELGSDAAVPTALVRDVNIGDLLGRPEEQLDMTPVAAFFRGKTVLITGGGGSIGSELCRRLLPLEPERIILYDISETTCMTSSASSSSSTATHSRKAHPLRGLHPRRAAPGRDLRALPARGGAPCRRAQARAPHGGLPRPGGENNVFGTWLTAQAAVRHGVKRFVLISTDKAVNPTNVMGRPSAWPR